MSDELETAVSESIPADAASAASAPAKPKRATTRKKAAPAAAAADAGEGAPAADVSATKVAPAAAEGDAPAAKKPTARKRTTAAKKTPAKTAAAADTEPAVKASATETPAPAESAGEAASTAPKKPATRKTTATRTRRKIAPAEAESPAEAETAPEAASDAAASASATVGANVASAVAPEGAANASETPARTPRTRTRTKASSAASGARSGAKKPAASRAKDAESSSDAAPLAPIEFSSDADVIATETLADPSLTAGQSPKGNGASAAEVLSVEVLVTDAPQSAASEVLIEASAEASSAEGSPEPAAPNRVRRERNNGANNGDRSNNERNDNNNKKRSKQNQNQNQNQGSSDKSNGQNQQGQNKANNKGSFDRDHRRQRRQHGSREVLPSISRDEFAEMKVGDLREKAAEYSIDASGYRKAELVDVVFEALCKAEGIIEVTGILDIMNDGYGFLRAKGYLPSEGDAYVSLSIIRRNGLRKGDYVVGLTRPAQGNEKYAAIQKVISVNDTPADELGGRVRFADLTPIYPDERLIMEHGKSTTTARVIDLVSPIGKGQRGLIVSPPKAGKTTVLKDIAAAISANNPEVHLMCLLVDERPEEVTDMERSIKGEVISSTFDKPCENHIAVAELVIERAKRLVEQGRDVVILLDSITRLARAYNMGTPASGRILSGGVDSSALYPPKRFLGAARNIENGGSLTILGTALVDTGSKMDEVIFEEFKGTGNMELQLDRSLSNKRIFPAVNLVASSTRRDDLLQDKTTLDRMWILRKYIADMNPIEAMNTIHDSMRKTRDNEEFLLSMNS